MRLNKAIINICGRYLTNVNSGNLDSVWIDVGKNQSWFFIACLAQTEVLEYQEMKFKCL